MDLYRVKQFYWAINSRLKDEDINFINSNLNNMEASLFFKLSVQEQKHCVNVAYDVINECTRKGIADSGMLIKAALLHDVGKTYKSLNVFDKSIMVICDNLFKDKMKKFNSIKKVHVYYNHSDIGYDILKEYEQDSRLLYLIKNHHNYEIKGDRELEILIQCDSRN